MSLNPGERLGPYEILSTLGEGGMGEVFRARDTRLNRTVAIKILRPDAAGDSDRHARFEREARAIASLSHPHICALHDVGGADAGSFLVMELIEGETLAARLRRGRLPLAEALTYGVQIAGALECAHRKGIVHRDLKPANIMLTTAGVKLLDFGLARLRAEQPAIGDATQTAALTGSGVILGTLQYIAPEQLEGREVDGRADLFALGAILYEMAVGRPAFEGSTPAALVSAIMQAQPAPISMIDPALPPRLDRLVTLCLKKNPDERWASAHDVQLLLKELQEGETAAPEGPAPRRWIPWGVAVAALSLAAALSFNRAPAADTSANVLSVLPAAGTTMMPGEAPQVSPDGRHVAFVATDADASTRLYVADRGSFSPRALDGTEDAMLPFWSPDSQTIGFFAAGRLKRVAVAGGTPLTLATAAVPRGGTWSRDGTIMFVPFPAQPPHTIPAAGGTPKPVPVLAALPGRLFPTFLPDSRHYIYMEIGPGRVAQTASLRLGSIDSPESTEIVQSRGSGAYIDPGYIVFRRERSLVVQAFDPERLELRGSPATLIEHIGFNPVTYQTLVSASSTGMLAYAIPQPAQQLVWFDRQGRQLGAAAPPGNYNSLCLSPDDAQAIYDAADPQTSNLDIWSAPVGSGGSAGRLTFDSSVDFYVVCSDHDDEIAFATLRHGSPSLYRLNLNAPGRETQMLRLAAPLLPTDWSQDGRVVVFSRFDPKTLWDVWTLPLASGTPSAFVATAAEERNARLSPDGRWMSYTSDESGAFEVYVQPFPATGAKWQVSRGGGQQSVWAPDGRELFYISPDKRIIGVRVTASNGAFGTSAPRVVIDARVGGWERTNHGRPYAITRDGGRLLVSRETDATHAAGVILDWPALVR
jgi:eukaryotic-like serine/threonine-protein kinase